MSAFHLRRSAGLLAAMPSPRPSPTLHLRCLLLALFFLLLTAARSQELDTAVPDEDPCGARPDAGGAGCRINCFRADPVCGVNGVTYWCGCPEAACAGVRVAKRGFCQVGNGGTGLVSGQALLLVHIVWLFLLGFSVLFGFL